MIFHYMVSNIKTSRRIWMICSRKYFFRFLPKYLQAVISLQRHISKFDQEIFISSSSMIRSGNNLLRKMKVGEGTSTKPTSIVKKMNRFIFSTMRQINLVTRSIHHITFWLHAGGQSTIYNQKWSQNQKVLIETKLFEIGAIFHHAQVSSPFFTPYFGIVTQWK